MASDAMAPYEEHFLELERQLAGFVAGKQQNEARWSWVASGRIALSPVLGLLTAVIVLADAPDALGAVSAIVTGLSSLATNVLPDDRKRVGNKVLASKAQNLLQRIQDREEELLIEASTPYQLLRRFRYEWSVLQATSSTVAAVQPFWEVPPSGADR